MTSSTWAIVLITVGVAIIFDVINGFHDAANSIATIVSTRVLKPHTAVLWAAFCNFLAMAIFVPRVAETISKIVIIEPNDPIYIYVVLAGVLGAIAWDLLTWWFGLPTSSSHALIGGFAGAGVAYAGFEALRWDKLLITIKFIFIAPLMGILLGFCLMVAVFWIFRSWKPSIVNQFFKGGQIVSSTFYSLGHGGNDAQKTMGVILAVMISSGLLDPETKLSLTHSNTLWIILICHAALALGTMIGGWKIVRTMGMKITKLKPASGFCAEMAGAITLFFSTYAGIPVSTTHTITGSIIGVGSATTRYHNVKWGIASRIIWSWIFTIPLSATISALSFYVLYAFVG
jgi:PiT family inorganic phosphate transporter